MSIKNIVKNTPVIGPISRAIMCFLLKRRSVFPGALAYWDKRYLHGGNSGAGSYGKLATFKSEVLNDFVKDNNIDTVIEFGCGDGNQLSLAEYPSYLGFDISREAVAICKRRFKGDNSKRFKLAREYQGEMAQLTLSLDVIYHLVDDEDFSAYMTRLFDSSTGFVIVYSSNSNGEEYEKAPHVKHRVFTDWVETNRTSWKLVKFVRNRYPYLKGDNQNSSFSDFYIFGNMAHSLK